MKKSRSLYGFLILFALATSGTSQTVEKFRFKKDPALIYFFQKGKRSDTLHKSQENFFYLIVPDTLKKSLSIQVENGQILPTANDSLVRFNYLPGFKYESLYSPSEEKVNKKGKPVYEFKTLVDGISILPHEKISISLINKATGGLLLENVFLYLK